MLGTPQAAWVNPYVVTCNWGTRWNTPHFGIGSGSCQQLERSSSLLSQKAWIRRRDRFGVYKEVRLVYQPIIDATVLRVCSHFRVTGVDILYGKNQFFFNMVDRSQKESPPSLLRDGVVFQPWAGKFGQDGTSVAAVDAIPLIEPIMST